MGDQVLAAYKASDFLKAKYLAKEYLELASIYRCNWNFGNAVHDTNRVLGLISLRNGDIDAATEYLLEASKSTGSPQLNTFGPELDLANQLLQLGKSDVVKSYLIGIKSFWKMDSGQVDAWLAEIDKGGKPELDRFAGNRPAPLLIFVFWLATLWPLIVSFGFLYAQRRHLIRKVLFLIVSVVLGYALMYAEYWAVGYGIQAVLSRVENIGSTTLLLLSYSPLAIALLLPVLAVFFVARFFRHDNGK